MTVYLLSNTPTKGSSHCVQNINIDSFVRLACMESNTSWMPGEGLRGRNEVNQRIAGTDVHQSEEAQS